MSEMANEGIIFVPQNEINLTEVQANQLQVLVQTLSWMMVILVFWMMVILVF